MNSPILADADPVEFRLKHLEDSRGRDVINKAAEGFGWNKGQKAPSGHGYGFAFARYKNLAAYCAIATEIEVNAETGLPRLVRAVAAIDSGQAVNPDGLTNQIEGAIMQSMSWTLFEAVTFDDTRITSIDWQTYPILRFNSVPGQHRRPHYQPAWPCRSSAAAKPGRGRRRRRSPTPSPTPPASGSATCR